jgi:hypothetical protein
MDGAELLREGHRLARPSIRLLTTGHELVGFWGGRGHVQSVASASLRHWLTIDARQIPGLQLSGCISVYADPAERTGLALHDPDRGLPSSGDGEPLFAHAAESMPPIDAIFRFGSESVGRWLRKLGWKRDWPYNDNFRGRDAVADYERVYQRECPFFSATADAVLGGWSLPWPDGDWEERLTQHLAIWTFRDAEPWLETWWDGKDWTVLARIT